MVSPDVSQDTQTRSLRTKPKRDTSSPSPSDLMRKYNLGAVWTLEDLNAMPLQLVRKPGLDAILVVGV